MKSHLPLALMSTLLTLAITASAAPQLAIGEMFPQLTLPSISDGAAVSIEQFRGQKLLLHIFASW